MFNSRQCFKKFRELRCFVNEFSAEVNTVGCEEHFWLELFKAFFDSVGTKVCIDHGPDRANGCGGKESDDRLRDIRQNCANNVTWTDTSGAEMLCERAYLANELFPTDLFALRGFVEPNECGRIGAFVGPAKNVFSVVEL